MTAAAKALPEAKLLVVDDEPNIVELLSASLRFAGFEVATAGDGAEALKLARTVPPRPRRARRDDARRRRVRRGPPDARERAAHPRPVPHRARRDRGQDHRPDPRRRRLRHQAVQPRGARRADPRGAAPHRRRHRPGRVLAPDRPRPRARRRQPRGAPRRRAGQPVADRVQAAALPDAQLRPGAEQGADPRPRVELRLQRRGEHRRVLRLLPAPQGRRRSSRD